MSLLGPRAPGKDVMNISTGKNQVVVDIDSVKHCLLNYGLKFAPSIAILVLAQALAMTEEQTNDHLNTVMCLFDDHFLVIPV